MTGLPLFLFLFSFSFLPFEGMEYSFTKELVTRRNAFLPGSHRVRFPLRCHGSRRLMERGSVTGKLKSSAFHSILKEYIYRKKKTRRLSCRNSSERSDPFEINYVRKKTLIVEDVVTSRRRRHGYTNGDTVLLRS